MLVCAKCGRESPDDARFCAGCGSTLEVAPPREERKTVTVLFADLVGFTSRAEQLDPEDVRATLQPYHARLKAELEHFGGTVEKFIGDAVMAVFGAPVVHEDDPERAVRAALAIRDQAIESELELRIAVHTGEALVTLGARASEGEGMVAGDVVNTAARLQTAAPVNGVLVGEATYRATAHVIEYGSSEPVTAKGKAEPVAAWVAVAPRARFGVDVDAAPVAPLIGRAHELEVLAGALARARQEHAPQLVTLVGEPGIGKSRLVTELFRIVDDDPEIILWRQGRCLPYGDGISYWALGEMAKAQAGVLESDSADEAERKLGETVGSLIGDAQEAEWVVRHLRPLLGLADESPQGEARAEAFGAWRRFLESLAERAPTVVVFEDLHWADDGMLDFVDALVDRAGGVPLLVLCSGRPELLTRRPTWGGGKANAVTLSLPALSDDDTARLVAALLDQAVLPAETQRLLLQRADGNPLFAEEYVRMLRDQGVLRRDGEVWRLAPGEIALPDTVQGIIAARLDALPIQEKTLLQAGAVVGKVFWLGAVSSIAAVARSEVEDVLHALERKEFVRRDSRASVGGESEFAFRHVLVRDLAYGQIPRAPRAHLHVRAADWIETLGEGRADDHAEMLAHHLASAVEYGRAAATDVTELVPRAITALRSAGDRARGFGAIDSALRLYERAVALDSSAADDPWLLLGLGRTRLRTGRGGEVELERAAEMLQAVDPEAAAEAVISRGEILWQRGERDQAYVYYERALAMVEPLADSPGKAFVYGQIARFWCLAGHELQALPLLESAIAVAEAFDVPALHADLLNTRGVARSIMGEIEEGIADLERSLELGRAARSYWTGRAYLNLGSTLADSGIDLDRAQELFETVLELAMHDGELLTARWARGNLTQTTYLLGRWQEAEAYAEAELAEPNVHYMNTGAWGQRAMIRLARGDVAGAVADSRLAVELARSIRDPQALLPALVGRAFVLLAAGRKDASTEVLAEFSDVWAEAEGRTPGDWSVILALVYHELGRPADFLEWPFLSRTRWLEAAEAVARGELAAAADTLQDIGTISVEAQVRLRLGRGLLAVGDRDAAAEQLQSALAFFQSVGAVAYITAAEELLPAAS